MAIYAVIKTGGKQYRVAPGDVVEVEKLGVAPGATVEISEVFLLAIEHELVVGSPIVADARVVADVIEEGRGEKIVIFKKKRRKGYQRTIGHRQHFTSLRIREIVLGDNVYKAAAAVAASRTVAPRVVKAAPVPPPKAALSIKPQSRAQSRGPAVDAKVVDAEVPDRKVAGTPSATPEPIIAVPQPVASAEPLREAPPESRVETKAPASPAPQSDLPRAQTPLMPPQPEAVEARASHKHRWYWLAAAIAVLLIGTGVLLFGNPRPQAPADAAPVAVQPAAVPSAPKPPIKEVTIKKPAAAAAPSAPARPPD